MKSETRCNWWCGGCDKLEIPFFFITKVFREVWIVSGGWFWNDLYSILIPDDWTSEGVFRSVFVRMAYVYTTPIGFLLFLSFRCLFYSHSRAAMHFGVVMAPSVMALAMGERQDLDTFKQFQARFWCSSCHIYHLWWKSRKWCWIPAEAYKESTQDESCSSGSRSEQAPCEAWVNGAFLWVAGADGKI